MNLVYGPFNKHGPVIKVFFAAFLFTKKQILFALFRRLPLGTRQFFLALGVLALLGCGARAQTTDPTGPQPKLPTTPLTIIADDGKSHAFTVELPVTAQQQAAGMMFRTNIPADTGMLFMFPQAEVQQFWMKNCPVPEDMLFIGADGLIKSIAEMTVPYSTKPVSSGVPVVAVLELQGGITAALDINVGDKVIAKPLDGG